MNVLLRKAEQALATARLALDAGDTDASVNRSYYAAYYAAWAMLKEAGLTKPKSHSGLITNFSQQFVKAGLFDPATGAIFGRLENLRLNADYTTRSIQADIAEQALNDAQKFVDSIKNYLSG